ncbi:alpha/beta fold hydrolase [Virgibacillus ihumii]|uniref:alpha/beta fold hydrolase n=1 Tax=Virgibacillus ihumii TaxID=2686091 RepID=UPI00157E1480|nr:alpha/beta fold hydrolase [Virgibacillus ihumii]
MEESFWITMDDNVQVYVKKWFDPSKQPKAIVQLAHGMVEHINRYKEFAEFLLSHDIFIYGNDHRGHGKTAEKQGLFGYLADENGFERTTEDLLEVTKRIKQDYPDIPLFLLGHSMGSFLARNYINNQSSMIDGVILSGTGYFSRTTSLAAKLIASTLPPKEKSPLMNSLAFSSYNRQIKNKRTNFDWLSNDAKIVQTYMEDPLCGHIPTARFFYDLMTGLILIHSRKSITSVRSELPMLFISGSDDPVGNYGKGVWKTANMYLDAGIDDAIVMLFDHGRHELLNEKNRDLVYNDILNWVEARMGHNA